MGFTPLLSLEAANCLEGVWVKQWMHDIKSGDLITSLIEQAQAGVQILEAKQTQPSETPANVTQCPRFCFPWYWCDILVTGGERKRLNYIFSHWSEFWNIKLYSLVTEPCLKRILFYHLNKVPSIHTFPPVLSCIVYAFRFVFFLFGNSNILCVGGVL